MRYAPIVVSLPIADRRTAHQFYRDGLNLEAVGDLAEDGLPEPLQFALNDGVSLMLVPAEGFGWVIGGHEVAPSGRSECILSLPVDTPADVSDVIGRARAAGAEIITEPGQQPWGYTGVFADPDSHLWMVISGAAG